MYSLTWCWGSSPSRNSLLYLLVCWDIHLFWLHPNTIKVNVHGIEKQYSTATSLSRKSIAVTLDNPQMMLSALFIGTSDWLLQVVWLSRGEQREAVSPWWFVSSTSTEVDSADSISSIWGLSGMSWHAIVVSGLSGFVDAVSICLTSFSWLTSAVPPSVT